MDARWPASTGAAAHIFVDELAERLGIGGDDGRHLGRVLRLRPGEEVTAADGHGRWRPYRVAAVSAPGVELEATGGVTEEPVPAPRLAVAFALTKGTKPELAIQKLTELGVDRILPVLSERSVARPGEPRAAGAAARWRRVALEAAKQSRRARCPRIAELAPLADLSRHPALVVAEWGAPPATTLPPPPGGELLIVVGPEGGLSPDEVDRLRPWMRIGLGPHVLRAETAALAAAAVVRGAVAVGLQ